MSSSEKHTDTLQQNILSLLGSATNPTARLVLSLQARASAKFCGTAAQFIAALGQECRSIHIPLYPDKEVEIGRSRQHGLTADMTRCNVQNPFLSSNHAVLGIDEHGPYLVDVGSEGLGSTNGTYVNGKRLAPNEKIHLRPEDQIYFGVPGRDTSEQLVIAPCSNWIGNAGLTA